MSDKPIDRHRPLDLPPIRDGFIDRACAEPDGCISADGGARVRADGPLRGKECTQVTDDEKNRLASLMEDAIAGDDWALYEAARMVGVEHRPTISRTEPSLAFFEEAQDLRDQIAGSLRHENLLPGTVAQCRGALRKASWKTLVWALDAWRSLEGAPIKDFWNRVHDAMKALNPGNTD